MIGGRYKLRLMKYMKKYLCMAIFMFLNNLANSDGGFYVGIGMGYGTLNNAPQSNYNFNNGGNGSINTNGVASNLYWGYNFNHYLGLQLDYNIMYNAQVANSYLVNQQLFGISALGHLPFGFISQNLNSLSIFAKVGADYNQVSFYGVNPNCVNCVNPPGISIAYTLLYGLGLEYGIKNIGLRLEWNATSNNVATNQGNNQVSINSNAYLLSIMYCF
jgi:hypothetical protein